MSGRVKCFVLLFNFRHVRLGDNGNKWADYDDDMAYDSNERKRYGPTERESKEPGRKECQKVGLGLHMVGIIKPSDRPDPCTDD